MRPESKQRIVGAIVLVAFIILLIPFLFTEKNGCKKPMYYIDNQEVYV